MNDKDLSESSGASVSAEGDVNISGDVVGHDKITHIHYHEEQVGENISQDIAIKGEGNIVVGKGDVIINPLPPAEARLRNDLGILLKNVETTWIKGVLEKSVHQAALLDLGVEARADAVDNPWRMVLEGPDRSRETLPRGKKIKDIFDETNRLLLILGEPGSGKTTTLLQLADDLIAEVNQAFTQPVPVILNLSTWTNKQQPMDDWLVAELNSKYHLPKKAGQSWLKERRILPLLDGLDEVKPENRTAAVEKINRLVLDYGLHGLVVCSRIQDYTALNVRLAFYGAIYLQPLTPEQIEEYFDEAGDRLSSLRATLRQDEALQSLARSPLILNIMSLAYQDTSAEALSNPVLDTDEARRRQLFDTYIARMFNRKVSAHPYDDEQTKWRLSWLARNMQRHNQEVFLIEGLQPSWLSDRRWQRVYLVASRMVNGLIFGLAAGLIAGLFIGPLLGLFLGLASGLSLGFLWELVPSNQPSQQDLKNDIKTVEALRWSWSEAAKGLFWGLLIGPLYGVVFGVVFGPTFGLHGWNEGLICGLLIGPMAALTRGLKREIIETRSVPNQGIRLSIRNAIFAWLIFGLSGGLIFELFLGPLFELFLGVRSVSGGLMGALGLGALGALSYGGPDIMQHYILRLLLVRQSHIPSNLAHFLDYAVDRIFLQKVGGGYRFIHRLFLEHFAALGETGNKV